MKSILISLLFLLLTACTPMSLSSENAPKAQRIYNQPLQFLYQHAHECVRKLGWKLSYANKNMRVIRAEAPMNIWTFGQFIYINFEIIDKTHTRVIIASIAKDQMLDLGRGSSTISEFYRKLDTLLTIDASKASK